MPTFDMRRSASLWKPAQAGPPSGGSGCGGPGNRVGMDTQVPMSSGGTVASPDPPVGPHPGEAALLTWKNTSHEEGAWRSEPPHLVAVPDNTAQRAPRASNNIPHESSAFSHAAHPAPEPPVEHGTLHQPEEAEPEQQEQDESIAVSSASGSSRRLHGNLAGPSEECWDWSTSNNTISAFAPPLNNHSPETQSTPESTYHHPSSINVMQTTSETNHNSNTTNTPETPRSHEENHEQRSSLDETCNNTNNHDQQNLDSIKEQIKHTQKLIRNLNRLNQNKWLKEQEELLELSITEGNKAETQRLCRAIAGQHRGILKRRHDQILVRKPLNAELTDMAQTPADEGGLGGTIINIDDQRHEWTTNAPEHRQAVNRDLNIDHLVKKELNQTIRTLKK